MSASAKSTKSAKSAPAAGLRGHFRRANLLTSLVLVFPLFIAYQLAVALLPGVGNGADLITARLVALLHTKTNYLLFNLALAAAFAILILLLRRRQQFDLRIFLPTLVESAIYALTMGSLILYGMGLLGIHPTLAVGAPAAAADPALGGPLTRVALSIGAGVNEELVFRLILLSLTVLLFQKLIGTQRWLAVLLAFLISSALFSAAHHVIGGEPWRAGVFIYRLFCGLFFAALFQWRGFAVAVYTHALYDIWVMVFH
jgi:hypothetical protein